MLITKQRLTLFLVVFVALGSLSLDTVKAEDRGALALSGGVFDVGKDQDAAEFRLEYRFGTKFFDIISPVIGGMATSDGAVYGYGGLQLDWNVAGSFYLTPSFVAGYYDRGSGKDLGHDLEFRSQLEASYRFDNEIRLGAAVSHISNAGIGDENPGAESAMLVLIIPLGAF